MIKLTDLVDNLPSSVPFVGPEAQERERKRKFIARIGANENVFGPSPNVLEGIRKVSSDIWMYADPENYELREALARHNNVDFANIVIGEGIDGLLGYLCRMFITPEVSVVTSKGAYPTFNYHVSGFGGNLRLVPYKNDFEDVDGLIREAEKFKASIIYIANPDNPMGSFHSKKVIEDMVASLPSHTLLCLDEAYLDFVQKSDVPVIDPESSQVIRMRTFSKAYGLAGARVGYAIGPKRIIKAFDKIRNHFGINKVSQHAAKLALEDQAYLKSVVRQVSQARDEISRIATNCGLKAIPSAANFVAVDCGKDSSFAKAILTGLIREDIFVRMPFVMPQNRCIRISVGKPEDLAILAQVLPRVVKNCTG